MFKIVTHILCFFVLFFKIYFICLFSFLFVIFFNNNVIVLCDRKIIGNKYNITKQLHVFLYTVSIKYIYPVPILIKVLVCFECSLYLILLVLQVF